MADGAGGIIAQGKWRKSTASAYTTTNSMTEYSITNNKVTLDTTQFTTAIINVKNYSKCSVTGTGDTWLQVALLGEGNSYSKYILAKRGEAPLTNVSLTNVDYMVVFYTGDGGSNIFTFS